MANVVQHLPNQNRYVFEKDGDRVGVADYMMRGNAMHFTHTEIDPTLRGGGLGAEMVQGVLDQVRSETEYRIVADCPFVADWLARHPDYHDLEERR